MEELMVIPESFGVDESKRMDVTLRIKDDCVPFDPKERQKITDPEDITKNIGKRVGHMLDVV